MVFLTFDIANLTLGDVASSSASQELGGKWIVRDIGPSGSSGFFHRPDSLSTGSVFVSTRYSACHLKIQRTSALCTPTLDMTPQGLSSSKPIFNAGLIPTTSLAMLEIRSEFESQQGHEDVPMMTSAPRPSVNSFTLLSRPSRSVWKFQGSAPRDLAKSKRDCIESTARRCLGL